MPPCREHTQTDTHPYGRCWLNGVEMGFHRRAWIQAHGPIPDGMKVCHRCDNPRCYEITHLFLGTQGDNMRDMVAKGRGPKTRLTPEQIAQIKSLWPAMRQKDIGKQFGIAQSHVSMVVNGRFD